MSPAPKGHPRWGNPMKPKKYTPRKLWEMACKYFEWADKNPIYIAEQSKMPQKIPAALATNISNKQLKAFLNQTINMPYRRPYTIEGMCIFLNITRETFDNYSKEKGYETHFDTCRAIREIIDGQHLEGGMVGQFNANIVTRKLGLQEKLQTSTELKIIAMDPEEERELNKAANAKKD